MGDRDQAWRSELTMAESTAAAVLEETALKERAFELQSEVCSQQNTFAVCETALKERASELQSEVCSQHNAIAVCAGADANSEGLVEECKLYWSLTEAGRQAAEEEQVRRVASESELRSARRQVYVLRS